MRELIEVGRDRLWFEDSGGDGPPVVLLHPGIADMRVWDPVWGPLTETHRAIRFDVRGFGGSPPAGEPYDWVEDLHAVLDHSGLDSAHLVGHSMGGGTALGLAVSDPRRVRTMVLLSPGVSGYPWPPQPELEERWAAVAAASDRDALIEFTLELWCAAGHEPFVRALVTDAARAEADANGLCRPPADIWDRLDELSAPVLLLAGDREPASMVEATRAAAARIGGSRLITLAGVDHFPQVRVPDLVVQSVRELCRG